MGQSSYIRRSLAHVFPEPKTCDDDFWNAAKRRQRPGEISVLCVTSFLSHSTYYLRALKPLDHEVQFTLILLILRYKFRYKFLPSAKEINYCYYYYYWLFLWYLKRIYFIINSAFLVNVKYLSRPLRARKTQSNQWSEMVHAGMVWVQPTSLRHERPGYTNLHRLKTGESSVLCHALSPCFHFLWVAVRD